MKKCSVCGRSRRGKREIIFVASKRGLRGVLACLDCVRLTVRVLVQPATNWTL